MNSYGGSGGIRTHGGLFTLASFQDWSHQPLGHASLYSHYTTAYLPSLPIAILPIPSSKLSKTHSGIIETFLRIAALSFSVLTVFSSKNNSSGTTRISADVILAVVLHKCFDTISTISFLVNDSNLLEKHILQFLGYFLSSASSSKSWNSFRARSTFSAFEALL